MIAMRRIEIREKSSLPHRVTGLMALLCLVTTAVWVGLLIYDAALSGPLDTPARIVARVARLDTVYYLTYVNAALVTLTATMLFAGLYAYCRPFAPAWSLMGLVLVPVYAVLNLFAYLSQITLVPALFELRQMIETEAAAAMILEQMIQAVPGSAVGFANVLAYAVLGIPSIIFGLIMAHQDDRLRVAGSLLVASGTLSILTLTGTLLGTTFFSTGTLLSGVLFLLALIPLSIIFLRARI